MPLGPIVQGLGFYLLLCSLSVLIGHGLLRLTQICTDERAAPALAPVLTFLFRTLALGLGGAFKIPTKFSAPVLWSVSILLALFGLRRPYMALRNVGLPWVLAFSLPIIVMAPCFATGLTESIGTLHGDGWWYIAG